MTTSGGDIQQTIMARAADDPAFRQRLLAAPGEALKEIGIHLPEGFQLRVVEESAQIGYLVLPARVDARVTEELRARVAQVFSTSAWSALGGR
jgi:hypothetical protein